MESHWLNTSGPKEHPSSNLIILCACYIPCAVYQYLTPTVARIRTRTTLIYMTPHYNNNIHVGSYEYRDSCCASDTDRNDGPPVLPMCSRTIPSQKAPPFPVNTFLSWNSNGYIKVNSFKHARPFVHYRFWAILMFLTGNTDKP